MEEEEPEIENNIEQNSNPNIELSEQTIAELDEGREIESSKKVEAALFISGKYMTVQELVALTDVNPILLKEILKKLYDKYKNENSAIEIIEKNNEYKMDVKPEHVNMINKLATGNAEFTKAEQETLAIIAYKQPVKQSVIIKIRGNKAYEHVKKFINLNLVKSKRLGHTLELNLSQDFYDYFNLEEKGKGLVEIKKEAQNKN